MKSKIYRFGPFHVDMEERLLLRDGEMIPLTPKAFDTLVVLAASPGKVIEKGELLKLVWPGIFVEENNLTQNISLLRKALGAGEYIETIPRRGYRLLAKVESVPELAFPSPIEPQWGPPLIEQHRKSRSIWTWSVAALLAATIVFSVAYFGYRNSDTTKNRIDSLVVLPFVNLSSDSEVEYFTDGLTEELTNAVAQLRDIRVVARTTAFQFKNKAQDVRSIAKQLQVNAVLEGSVRRQANRLRVTVQLDNAITGFHLWSQTYDRNEEDLFNVQEDISRSVARILRPDSKLSTSLKGTRSLEAYKAYLLGQFHRNRPDTESRKRAIPYYELALRKDPRYAAAYAGLAQCYTVLAWESSGISPLEAYAAAQKAVNKALELDPDLPDAHTSQAIVSLQLARDWPRAEQHFRRAIALNGSDAEAHHWLSHYLVAMGRLNESLAESRLALELDPMDVQISAHLSWHYLKARDYPNAIKAGLHTLELDPHSELAYLFLAWTYEYAGNFKEAIQAWQRAGQFHPDQSLLQKALQVNGEFGYWQARMDYFSRMESPNDYQVAAVQSRLVHWGKALDHLERAFQMHEPELIYVKREAAFDSLASNPRFKALTNALNLP